MSELQYSLNTCSSGFMSFLPLSRTVLYECCPGYMKLDGLRGCPAGWLTSFELLTDQSDIGNSQSLAILSIKYKFTMISMIAT